VVFDLVVLNESLSMKRYGTTLNQDGKVLWVIRKLIGSLVAPYQTETTNV
jgi:hypothetical protein